MNSSREDADAPELYGSRTPLAKTEANQAVAGLHEVGMVHSSAAGLRRA